MSLAEGARYQTPSTNSPEYFDPREVMSPLYDEREILPTGNILDLERSVVQFEGGHKMPQVIYHVGIPVGMKELEAAHLKAFPDEKSIGDTHFDRIYITNPDISEVELVDEELDLAVRMGRELLEMGETKPDDIEAVYVASGYPIINDPRYPYYAAEVAQSLGLKKVIQSGAAYEYFMACNSGGEAARDSMDWIRHPELQGKKVLRLNFELLRRPIPGIVHPGKANSLSSRMFSNAAAGELVIPGVTESILPDKNGLPLAITGEREDEKAFLGAVPAYQNMVDPQGKVLQFPRKNTTVARLPIPMKEGFTIYMVDRAGVFFRSLTVDNMVMFVPMVNDSYPGVNIAYANHHPASYTVFDNLGTKLAKLGIDIPSIWYALDGNSSAASSTITKIRARRDGKIREGELIIDDTYGAGSTFTIKAQTDGDPRAINPDYDELVERHGAFIERRKTA